MSQRKRVLIVAAHPDDEILGCGATIVRLIASGYEAHVLILGEGVTSRDKQRDPQKRKKGLDELKQHVHRANKIIGVKDVILANLPDNRFDALALLDVVKIVEKVKKDKKPDVIFTHFQNDLNIDHGVTHRAVMTATRPMWTETVKEIYSFEVASSTEWNYPLTFSPDIFYDVSKTLEVKLQALKEYKVEMKDPRHPRSIEGVTLQAQLWGLKTGVRYAEAFKTVRVMR